MVAVPRRRSRADPLRRETGASARLPSPRTIVTVAAIVVTAILILEWGVWYFAGLVLLYGALDIAQRLESRRDAATMIAILRTAGRKAGAVTFVGPARHCERAAWIARELGWLAGPMVRARFMRHSIQFLPAPRASPLSTLLQTLRREDLITRLRVPEYLPKSSPDRASTGLGPGWEA